MVWAERAGYCNFCRNSVRFNQNLSRNQMRLMNLTPYVLRSFSPPFGEAEPQVRKGRGQAQKEFCGYILKFTEKEVGF
jgi:hypothetical protein